MRSNLPKVLHPIGGRPMLHHVLDTARALSPSSLHVVIGHAGEQVQQATPGDDIEWHWQQQQLGTGHAVQQAMGSVRDDEQVLVLYGDVPLIRPETLENLVAANPQGLSLLTVVLSRPDGYGRIVRDADGKVLSIVEHKDATEAQRQIREVNTGILTAPAQQMRRWLDRLDNDNAQGEFYLTDIVAQAVADKVSVRAIQAEDAIEVEGVNQRAQQALLERAYQRRVAAELMHQGVTLMDPERIDVRGRLTCGQDVTLDVGVIIEGDVHLGDGVSVGPYTLLKNCTIDERAQVKAHCVIENARIGQEASVGPFARLRPGAVLKAHSHVGNFVEIKNATLGEDAKAGHLAYIGDAEVGARVNIGAGTITCNYDGANKHRTVLGDDVFVGSDTQLVAPVSVGRGATIGAGTTVTHDIPEGVLAISRVKQKHIEGWQRPVKRAADKTTGEESK